MPTWNADQYLKFAEERTQPCRDLAARVGITGTGRIIDLGCGPGNSTSVLAGRWPAAEITGLDGSVSMIEVARRDYPQRQWIIGDITQWALKEERQFQLVFSNAALHWVPDHEVIYPKLFERVAPGGAFAVQIPADFDSPPHRLMRQIAKEGASVREWHSHTPAFYYDLLASGSLRVDIWETEYLHVVPDAEAIVEWYKGSGLRPFLEVLETDVEREEFLKEYSRRIRLLYVPRSDGKVLFPFRRLFVVAYR